MSKKVLLAGESWMSYTTHVKGFDSFYTSTYETGEKWLKAALEAVKRRIDDLDIFSRYRDRDHLLHIVKREFIGV